MTSSRVGRNGLSRCDTRGRNVDKALPRFENVVATRTSVYIRFLLQVAGPPRSLAIPFCSVTLSCTPESEASRTPIGRAERGAPNLELTPREWCARVTCGDVEQSAWCAISTVSDLDPLCLSEPRCEIPLQQTRRRPMFDEQCGDISQNLSVRIHTRKGDQWRCPPQPWSAVFSPRTQLHHCNLALQVWALPVFDRTITTDEY